MWPALLLAVLALLLTWPQGVQADLIKTSAGITLDPVAVQDVSDGVVKYRVGAGPVAAKGITDVALLKLTSLEEFNKAEDLAAAKQYDKAASGYALAAKSATAWQKTLCNYRRLAALDQAGQIDLAVQAWLDVVDAENGAKGVLALKPKGKAAKGEAANDRAIALLKARTDRLKQDDYATAAKGLLAELYAQQGKPDQAEAVAPKPAAETAKPDTTAKAGNGGKTTSAPAPLPPVRGSAGGSAHLQAARNYVKAGQFDRCVSAIQDNLRSFRTDELPAALVLLGQAQLELAKTQKDDQARATLTEAGLNLMRVVSNFGDSDSSQQALCSAGEVNERLGNYVAAKAAYEAAVGRGETGEAGKRAKTLLAELKAKPAPASKPGK